MPGNDDKKKVLYDAVSKDYDVGTYDDFINKLSNPTKRKAFYEGVGSEYDLGDYNTFNQKLGYDSQETKQKSQLPFLSTPDQQLTDILSKPPTEQKSKYDVNNQNDQFLNFGEPVIPVISPLAVAVNKDKKKEGSALGGVYNTLVGSVGRFAGGVVELKTALTKATVPLIISGSGKDGEFTEAEKIAMDYAAKATGSREDIVEDIDKARLSSSTKEQEQARKEFDVTDGVTASDVEAMLFQAPSQVADMVMGAFSGGSSFFVQSINDNAEELEKTPNAVKLSDNEKLGYLLVQATVQAALEKLALDKILKSTGVSKSVQQKISKEIIDEFVNKGTKATAKEIEDLAIKKATQFTSKVKRVGLGTATGTLTEAVTEGVQSGASDAIKLTTNAITGKNVFDEDDIKKNFIKNAINSAVLGGAFGGVFGGLSGTVNNTNKAIREQVSQAQIPEDLQEIQQQISEQVESGNLTEEEANNANIKVQQYADIVSKIPTNIDTETKYKIIGGIEQRTDLENEIQKVQTEMEGVDPAFHKDKKDRLELLQGKLGEVNDYLEGIVEGSAPTYEERNGKYIKISAIGEETEIPKQQYEFGKAIQENEKIKQEEPQQIEGDIATEQQNITEDGKGERREEGRQDVLTEPQQTEGVAITEAEQATPSIEDNISIGEVIDKPIIYKGQKATLYKDGQTLVVKINDSNREYELGNVEELKDVSISDFDIEHETSLVSISENGLISLRGNNYKTLETNPLNAINRDDNGNIISVTLATENGQKRTFRGSVAEDIAYQLTLKEINKDETARAEFEQFITNNESIAREINDAEVSASTKEKAIGNNEAVPRQKAERKSVVKMSAKKKSTIEGFQKQREQEIDIATKPDLALNFIENAEILNKEVMGKGKNRKGEMVDKKVKYGKAQATIKAKYEFVKKLIDCLDT